MKQLTIILFIVFSFAYSDMEKYSVEITFNDVNQIQDLVKIDIERGEIPVLKRGFDRFYADKTIILCEILDQEDFTKFENLFTKQDYKKLLIDDKNKKYKVVSDLSEAKKVGRNVIFIPLEKIDEVLNVIKSC